MTDTTNKTPGQVAGDAGAQAARALGYIFYRPVDHILDAMAAAVLAHAAPKWHPVSEPVPDNDCHYFVRLSNGVWMPLHAGDFKLYAITHWCGPIEPTPFEENP